ncbi:hypothetical protein AB833_03445 [Chromatiales bacterium (ex Bugula neritina AB1)]|nr:hypothetical protein AB833_03445 [Chromatiales bacterium (ex Bugula neritina AB1)]
MAIVSKTVACLRVIGDDVITADITGKIGCEPTRQMIKGEPFIWSENGKPRIAKTGMWRLESPERIPGDLNSQVSELLCLLTKDLSIWESLSRECRMDISCGVFMEVSMEGIGLTADTLLALGQRGVEIDFDIYGPD